MKNVYNSAMTQCGTGRGGYRSRRLRLHWIRKNVRCERHVICDIYLEEAMDIVERTILEFEVRGVARRMFALDCAWWEMRQYPNGRSLISSMRPELRIPIGRILSGR
jgi:hypothetical protein